MQFHFELGERLAFRPNIVSSLSPSAAPSFSPRRALADQFVAHYAQTPPALGFRINPKKCFVDAAFGVEWSGLCFGIAGSGGIAGKSRSC